MKTFLSLRKQIKTPIFIGFASSVIFHLGLVAGILGVFDRSENLQEIGLAQITMSLASINTNANQKAYSTPTKPRHKRHHKHHKKHHKHHKSKHPIPLEEPQEAQEQSQENPSQEISSKEIPTELESKSASNQDSQGSTYESLAFNEGISDEFYQKVQAEIRKKHHYPRLAQIREMQGSVWVDFILEPNGEIKNLKVYRSNTGDILNTQALKSVLEAHKNFPKPQKVVRLKIEVNYNLEQK